MGASYPGTDCLEELSLKNKSHNFNDVIICTANMVVPQVKEGLKIIRIMLAIAVDTNHKVT